MKTISISKEANKNYLAKIVQIKKLTKHPNADKLQVTQIDFQNVITGMDMKEGDVCVFWPLEAQINKEFLASTNSFRDKELNQDKGAVGFFEDKGRVKAVKLRGEKSMGFLCPIKAVEDFTKTPLSEYVGEEFDTIGDILMCKKYIIPVRTQGMCGKNGKKPKVSRLIQNLVHFHVDTENLRREVYKIKPEDTIDISYKIHGSSGWAHNVRVKRKLNLLEKLLKTIGIKIDDTEYDVVYGSRRVVKNGDEKEKCNHFYGYDLWGVITEEIKELIPKGFAIYYEICGFTKDGAEIQKKFDYNCNCSNHRIFVYRVTFTNDDGVVSNLSTMQMRSFCDMIGLECVPLFFYGKAKDVFPEIKTDEHWHEEFIKKLEEKYTNGRCYICMNDVPREGIVIRKEKMNEFEAYKLKSWEFLEYESAVLDDCIINIEDKN